MIDWLVEFPTVDRDQVVSGGRATEQNRVGPAPSQSVCPLSILPVFMFVCLSVCLLVSSASCLSVCPPAGCFGHGFSTRCGGVSSGSPSLCSLNLASSRKRRDPDVLVTENWRRLALHAGFSSLPLHLPKVLPLCPLLPQLRPMLAMTGAAVPPHHQVSHGAAVWVLGREQPDSYDAVVTDQRGVVLAAPGADCMTLLFADPRSKVIAAAHAGETGSHCVV